jgi:hypothetical protein
MVQKHPCPDCPNKLSYMDDYFDVDGDTIIQSWQCTHCNHTEYRIFKCMKVLGVLHGEWEIKKKIQRDEESKSTNTIVQQIDNGQMGSKNKD